MTEEIISDITAAHNIETMFWVMVAIRMETGTKIMTSRNKASIVDFRLFPIDCKIIEADLI